MKNDLKTSFITFACSLFFCSQGIQNLNATCLDNQIPLDYSLCAPYDLECEFTPYWMEIQYLNWQTKKSPNISPLVFTGIFDEAVTPTLQTPGTKIVLGDRSEDNRGRSGLKVSAGYSLCDDSTYGTHISYTFLQKKIVSHTVRSNDFDENHSDTLLPDSYLAIPFFDASTQKDSSVYIAKPGSFAGKATLRTENWMQGAEWNFSMRILNNCPGKFQIYTFTGLRYWNFNDELTFKTYSPSTTNKDVFTTVDKFMTDNTFFGAQIGFDAKYICCNFFCNANFKIAFGGINQRLKIRGQLLTNDFNSVGANECFPGGYFAQPSNRGNYRKTKFAYLPEVNLNFGYQICDCFSVKIGYTFLFVSKIWWAENQLDRKINPSQSAAITRAPSGGISGIPGPKRLLKSKNFWVQGLDIGFGYQF